MGSRHRKPFFVPNFPTEFPGLAGVMGFLVQIYSMQVDQCPVLELAVPSIRWAYLIIIVVTSKHKLGNIACSNYVTFCRHPRQPSV